MSGRHDEDGPRPVRLDNTLTLGLALAIMIETAGALIWVGSAEARITRLESRMSSQFNINERLARLEGETAVVSESVRRIEEALLNE